MAPAGIGEYGERLMNCFKWGHAFYSVNNELLDKYSACATSTEVVDVQNRYLAAMDNKEDQDTRGEYAAEQSLLHKDWLTLVQLGSMVRYSFVLVLFLTSYAQ